MRFGAESLLFFAMFRNRLRFGEAVTNEPDYVAGDGVP